MMELSKATIEKKVRQAETAGNRVELVQLRKDARDLTRELECQHGRILRHEERGQTAVGALSGLCDAVSRVLKDGPGAWELVNLERAYNAARAVLREVINP